MRTFFSILVLAASSVALAQSPQSPTAEWDERMVAMQMRQQNRLLAPVAERIKNRLSEGTSQGNCIVGLRLETRDYTRTHVDEAPAKRIRLFVDHKRQGQPQSELAALATYTLENEAAFRSGYRQLFEKFREDHHALLCENQSPPAEPLTVIAQPARTQILPAAATLSER